MAIRRTEAVVLKTQKLGETSKLVTAYSPEQGLLKLLAKGARKPGSRLGGSLEPLYTVELVYYEKETRDLQLVSQVSLIEAPRHILEDADRTVLALACCEIVSRLEKPANPSPSVYGLLRATIKAMDHPEWEPRALFLAFQLRLLAELGMSPEIQRCSSCKSERPERAAYDFAAGRLYCARCAPGILAATPLESTVLLALRMMAHQSLASVGRETLARRVLNGVYEFILAFYRYHLEELGTLRSIEVLKQMKQFQSSNHSKPE